MTRLGYKIKKVREFKGIKQEEIAAKLKMSQQNYSKYEEKEDISDEKFKAIAEALEVDPEIIRNFDEKNVFNNILNDQAHAQQVVSVHNDTVYNQFPPELKQLYEDKIILLEEKIRWLEGEKK